VARRLHTVALRQGDGRPAGGGHRAGTRTGLSGMATGPGVLSARAGRGDQAGEAVDVEEPLRRRHRDPGLVEARRDVGDQPVVVDLEKAPSASNTTNPTM